MLIPDLLNILFDQTDYSSFIVLVSLNKRRTMYANKYSVLNHYGVFDKSVKDIFYCYGKLKMLKHVNNACIGFIGSRGGEFAKYCAGGGYMECMKYLAKQGANVHYDNYYPFEISAEYGHLEMVKYLLNMGSDIHADNDHALRWSANNGHLEIVKYLVGKGANVHCVQIWNFWRRVEPQIAEYLSSVGACVKINEE